MRKNVRAELGAGRAGTARHIGIGGQCPPYVTHRSDHLSPTKRFSPRVENYSKYRPGYARQIVELLKDELGLTNGALVADIGSGTGLLSRIFLQNGNLVYGVEPNNEMRQEAQRLLASFPSFNSIDGTAEATTLPDASVDAVVAGQAFHWFDQERAAAEFRRISGPNGIIALVWNVRKSNDSPFMEEYNKIVADFATESVSPTHEAEKMEHLFDRLKQLFGSGLRTRCFDNVQDLNWEGIRGRLLSSSYAPLDGQPGHEPMIEALRCIFDRHQRDCRVRINYTTMVYFGPLGLSGSHFPGTGNVAPPE